MVFRVAFVAGVTPDRWVRTWGRRETSEPLDLALVGETDQRAVVIDGRADVCLARMPIDRTGLHCIPLYSEVQVVVVPKGHPVTAYDEIRLPDLEGEQLLHGDVPGWVNVDAMDRLSFPEMTVRDAIDVVASGTGIVIVPMGVARLHHRRDVEHRPVIDLAQTQIGLVWLVDNDDPRVETFIGIVRGRTENSSRGKPAPRRHPRR